MRRALAVALLVVLGACANEKLEAEEVRLPDGKVITCVHDDGDKIRAVDCDWSAR